MDGMVDFRDYARKKGYDSRFVDALEKVNERTESLFPKEQPQQQEKLGALPNQSFQMPEELPSFSDQQPTQKEGVYGPGTEGLFPDPELFPAQDMPLTQGLPPEQNLQTTESSFYDVFPEEQRGAAQKATPLIAEALQVEGIYSPEVLAYALATVEHETGGGNSVFQSPREGYFVDERYGLEPGTTGKSEARKRGYSGGENYYGRGYTMLTHDYNYKEIGERIGMGDELLNNPDLALEPKTAAKIMAAFFKDKGVADDVKKYGYTTARRNVNPDTNGPMIARYAEKYQAGIQKYQDEILPGEQKVNQQFGNYNPKVEKYSGGINKGVDLSANKGDPIAAPGGGRWKAVEVYAGGGMNNGWGNSVMLQNMKTGEKLRFSHLDKINIQPGQELEGGNVFGTVGTTGNTTGAHSDIEYYDAQGRIKDFMKSRYRRYL